MKIYGAILFGLVLGAGVDASAAGTTTTTPSSKTKHHSAGTAHVATKLKVSSSTSHTASKSSGTAHGVTGTRVRHGHGARPTLAVRRTRYQEHFSASSYADNLTLGDVIEGEDPVVRAAAIEALGNMNGTAIAIDPSTGRILAMVNQKLALSHGAEPCSTIKLTVALAALEEGIVTKDTPVNLGGKYHLTMTEALAHSNNLYFETLGRQLGFERVKHYANEFGLGELAGYHIQGEQLGTYPDEVLPASLGGVGRMCSFGESVSMTPLQLGALVSAIANGGTLYYLQHPENSVDVATFEPKVKRVLSIAPLIPEISVGMQGAVQYGTARSLRANFSEFPVMGKTGTCSNNGTRFGWFGSYADTPNGRIVTVFFLEGGRPTFGPKAAELTGAFYRALWDKSYFIQKLGVETSGVVGGGSE
ncbi:penicillin-binding transpeptidase domain-containing protein [Tunturiibacter lichenicola]|uniref:penicillin-binding transpeptidase domain-containing protein n=1 Tax=Tunturiibacter lichenicola TaxID=2051959 RepID=UPI0021B4881B|nr:penicillin-binding transpeptidase domain-containing protein [Edaphobacter lichenicola]